MKKRMKFAALLTATCLVMTSLPGSLCLAEETDSGESDSIYSGYELKWADEFSGDSLNRDNWNVETHEPGWVNSELQSYEDSEDNISVHDGALYLTAQKNVAEDGSVSYTSGRVNTQNLETYTYGMFEVRAKVPEGAGYLPAFWLMANDENTYGQWPRCGEIDAMEVMGQDPSLLYGTLHYGNPHRESQGTYSLTDSTFADDFHTFTCEWEPGKITWYVDGIKYYEESDWYSTTVGQGTKTYPAPFDQPFYIILNLAVGGSWVGNPDETTSFDDNPYVIDYVRVYQKDSYDENVTKPEKEVSLRDPDADGNYIVNGDFSDQEDLTDDTNWKFLTALSGEAEASISDGAIHIDTTNEGTVDYSVQLVQANLPFEKGATYQVSFDACSSEARTMKTAVKAPDYGYIEYMPATEVSLGQEKQTYTYTFKMTESSDANGRLEFNMGAAGSTADIDISNVSVKKIAEPDPDEVEEKTVLSDGNYVYNASFDEGTGHLGSWELINNAGASVSVTSFSDGRRLKLDTSSMDEAGQLSDLTLEQSDLAFTSGSAYAFSFEASSEKDCTIEATVGGQKFTADLTSESKTYTFHIPADTELTDSDISFSLAAGTVLYLDNVRLVEDSLIKNGSFNAGTSGYEVYIDSSASASYVVDSQSEDNALDVTVKNTGDQDWKVQVKQNNVNLENGKWYKLTFDAKSSLERDIRVILQGDESHGWPVYSGENIVSLTDQYQTFTKTFQMTADTDATAFLSICLGNVSGQITDQHRVCIDNISLEEVEAPEQEEAETGVNLLKNPDFSDATDPMTAWTETIANWGSDYTTDASHSIEDGKIIYDIKNAGAEDWHVQLKQSNLSLEAGATYKVTFQITSTASRTVKSGVMSTAYNWYGGQDISLVANTAKSVSYVFTMDTADQAADFYISMGKYAGEDTPASVITISDLSIVKEEASAKDSILGMDYEWSENEDGTYTLILSGEQTASASQDQPEIAKLISDSQKEVSAIVCSAKLTDASYLFAGLGQLKELDLSQADLTSLAKADDFLKDSKLHVLKTAKAPACSIDLATPFYPVSDNQISSSAALTEIPAGQDQVLTLVSLDSHYSSAAFQWAKDYSSCSYSLNCDDCGISGTITAKVTSAVTKASASADGKITYLAQLASSSAYSSTKTSRIAKIKSVTLGKTSVAYTGKAIGNTVVVKDADNKTISSSYYTLSYKNNTKVGTATATITMKGRYTGTFSRTYKIVKAANPICVSSGKTYTKSQLARKSQTFTIKVKNAKGSVSFKSNSKYVSVTSKGKVTVKKGCPKGSYKVTVTAKGDSCHNAGSKTVTIKVK